MQVLAVTWGFPRHDQPFLITKFGLLSERGHKVRVLCAPGDEDLEDELETQLSGRVETRPALRERPRTARELMGLLAAATRDPRFVMEATRTLQRQDGWDLARRRLVHSVLPFAGEHPDVVHFEFANWAAGFTEVLPLLHCPTVVTCHGSDVAVEPLHDAGLRRRLAVLFERVDRVVCVSAHLARAAVGLGADPSKVVVIPMGVDTRLFSPSRPALRAPGGETRLLSVGRLHWVKGYEYALQAVDILRTRGYRITYTIAGGDGGGGQSVRLARRDLGLGEIVTLTGFVPRGGVRDLLAMSDIFVLPSVTEGLSTAALEAMAAGVPVVVTAVGGMPDAVDHGHSGLVVPPRDPVELADAIEVLIADPELRQELAAGGVERVRGQFDAGRHTDQLVTLYEELVGGRPGHADQPSTIAV
jgi:colanic acid/amylovoran biosynthesis glycosyltransferase